MVGAPPCSSGLRADQLIQLSLLRVLLALGALSRVVLSAVTVALVTALAVTLDGSVAHAGVVQLEQLALEIGLQPGAVVTLKGAQLVDLFCNMSRSRLSS